MSSRAVIAVLFAGLALAQNAQSPGPQAQASQPQPPSIKVQVDEVIVPVTVTDDRGRFVSNLDAADFRSGARWLPPHRRPRLWPVQVVQTGGRSKDIASYRPQPCTTP